MPLITFFGIQNSVIFLEYMLFPLPFKDPISNFGQKSQYCVIWGKITRILTKWLPEIIPNLIKIPNMTLETYSLWYCKIYNDLVVGL